MKRRLAILSATAVLAIVSVTGCFSQKTSNSSATKQSGNSANPTNATWTSTRNASIQDPAYGMTAYTIAVPAGWKYAGMILRPGGCHPPSLPAYGLSYIEESPDGLTAYAQLPGVSWSWTSNGSRVNPKCPADTNITTAAGLLLNIAVPNLHPNATSVVLMPLEQKDQDQVKQKNQQLASQSTSGGLYSIRHFLDMARVVVTYDLNGVTVQENLGAVVDCTETTIKQMSGVQGRPPSQGTTSRTCTSRGTYITRAPKGYLDAAMKSQIMPQFNADWDSRVIQDIVSAAQQRMAASNAAFAENQKQYAQQYQQMQGRAKQFDANLRQSTDNALAADRSRQAGIDNSAHQTALYVLDKQTFVNPSTGERIEASNQYNHQWMSSDGSTLIQTQDHSFDPNGVVYPVSQSWTELVPTN